MTKTKKDKQTNYSHMTQHRKLVTKQNEPPSQKKKTNKKTGDDLRCSGRVSRSCSLCDNRRVAHAISNPGNSSIR